MRTSKHSRLILFNGLLTLFIMGYVTAAEPLNNSKVTVYRCVDGKGKVSLQDVPCAGTSSQETLNMVRPKDALSVKTETSKPTLVSIPVPSSQTQDQKVPPPELFRCTDFDGKVRDAEYDDPKPRCVPLWALGYETRSNSCRWVEDSCVRYEGKALCTRWEEKAKQAELDVRHASSSDTPFLKSELARFTQIVQTSCRW